jgi:hypothetical protein
MKSTTLSTTVHFKMPMTMFKTLQRIAEELDLSYSQILRRSFREFVGLHQLQQEYGANSVVDDPPKKVLGVPEGF